MNLDKILMKSKGIEVEELDGGEKSFVKKIGDTELNVIRGLNESSDDPCILPLVVSDGSEVFVLYNPIEDKEVPYTLNNRPKKALKKLATINTGIPRLCFVKETQKTDECVIEYPDGTPLSYYNILSDKVPNNFFNDLSSLVKKIHKKEVANLGLDKLSSIIITKYPGKPVLLGFENSISKEDKFFGWLYKLAKKSDWYNFYKLKEKFRPEQLVSKEIKELESGLKQNPYLSQLWSQIELEELISKKVPDRSPPLSFFSYLIESMLRNYPRAEKIFQG